MTRRVVSQSQTRLIPTMARPPISSCVNAAGFAALLLLAPYAMAQTGAAQDAERRAAGSAAPAGELSAELMYRLLVGDIAMQRGDPALAARAYYEAAKEARDPRLARRATEIALVARQRSLAQDAATLWSELDPTAERAKQVIAGLKGGGDVRGGDLKADLERALAEAAASGPRLGEAFMELNRALASEPDKAATFKLVQALAQPYSGNPEANFAVALAAFNTGLADFDSTTIALQAVDRALMQKPGWEQAMLLKVEILGKQSLDRAADYLVDILKTAPDSKPANSALVQVRIQQKRYADAAVLLQKLADKDPGNQEYQFGLAMLAMQTKDWVKAERLLEELNRADYGDDGVIETYLAQVAEETGRFDLALERYKAVPDGERGWFAKLRAASMLGKLGRLGEARQYLASLPATTREQQIQVQQVAAQLLRDANDNQAAFATLSSALTEYPDDPDLLYDLAMVAEKLDRIDVVESKLTRLVELRPSNAHALNALGYTLVDRTPRVTEGLALIERALALAPDDPFILDSVGWAQFRLGRLDEAEKYLRRAMEQRPDPEIAAHLGEVLWAKGDRARAQDLWQTQLKSAPDNAVLLETVRRLTR
jgi:tetratricopeptide (TPR) repeat protein